MPAATGCTLGAALPAHASADTDFTTTAPSSLRSKYALSSAPWPEVPDAVITGFGSTTSPMRASSVINTRPGAESTQSQSQRLLVDGVVVLQRRHLQRAVLEGG